MRKLPGALAFALAAAAGLPHPAAAETDFATAAKVQCVPDTVTRCTEPGKCTTRPASERDKTQVLVIDFAAKTVAMRRGEEMRQMGRVTEDKVEGGMRKIVMSEGEAGSARKASLTLSKDGKLSIDFGGAGGSAEATCKAA